MDTVLEVPEDQVVLDSAAASKLADFIAGSEDAEDATETIALRVSVVGGGCAGFQYRLSLDRVKEDDHVFTNEDQQVIVDPVTMTLIGGSTITYRDGVEAQGFEVLNPRAVNACGCGSSFTVED